MTTDPTSPDSQSSEISAVRSRAGEFILALVQAFLRSGYYLPEHPETHKAKAGLYERFRGVVSSMDEITFLVTEAHGRRSVVIEGIEKECLRFSDIMLRGMADTYAHRFLQFMERKELLCLSLSSRLGKTEFSKLIDVMSEPAHENMCSAAAKARFVKTLQIHSISNISFVFVEDFLHERPAIPWRTRLALSRLKKDLYLLPILHNLGSEGLIKVKQQILSDIIRPLADPALVYSLLLNFDLATSDLVSEEDAEQWLFGMINDTMLQHIARFYLNDAMAADAKFPGHVTVTKRTRMLNLLRQRLIVSKDPKAVAVLELLYRKGLIALTDLPGVLRTRIILIKRLATYLAEPERFLRSLESDDGPEKYAARLKAVSALVPLLAECGRFNEAVTIVQLLNRHALEKSGRTPAALQERAYIISGSAPRTAAAAFLKAPKEVRSTIGLFFRLLSHGAIPHLLHILIESTDPWRSKQAAEIMISIGRKAIESLIHALDSNMLSSVSLPVLLRVLCDSNLPAQKNEILHIMLRHLKSSVPEVRREAMQGLAVLNPQGSYAVFYSAIEDKDLKIKRIAVSGIGRGGDSRAFGTLKQIVEKGEKSSSQEDHDLAAAALEAMGVLALNSPALNDMTLTYLAGMVNRYCERNSLKRLLSGFHSQPASMLLSLAEALGRLRDADVSGYLAKMAGHHHHEVAQRAAFLLSSRHEQNC